MPDDQLPLLDAGKPDPLPLSPTNAAFEKFWQIKPARAGNNPKGDAAVAFRRLVAGGIDPETIIEAARQWAVEVEKDVGTKFVKQAVFWLSAFGRETKYQASDPTSKKTINDDELDEIAQAHGYRWNGRKYERLPGYEDPSSFDRSAVAPVPRNVKDRAVLFCSRNLEWFAPLAERHEASDKQWSFYGPGPSGNDVGIWVPVNWFDQVKHHREKALGFGDLHTPAREIVPPGFKQPFASALPEAGHPIDMDGPPLEAYADALSMPEEVEP